MDIDAKSENNPDFSIIEVSFDLGVVTMSTFYYLLGISFILGGTTLIVKDTRESLKKPESEDNSHSDHKARLAGSALVIFCGLVIIVTTIITEVG